ncbi:MAG: hypothetical protein IIV54_01025 [Bacteroidaceae bacterium]|nr:hypothetical protein [Bacteroidaceae bacterium]
MKKTYIQPETIAVRLETEGMIAASLKISDKEVDTSNGGQLTNKKNPIWGGEEEEAGNGYW